MPVTTPVTMSKIVAEFGGPGNLRAYNRGGLWVPSNASNMAISTNPASLKLSQFAGASNATALTVTANPSFLYEHSPSSGTIMSGVNINVSGGPAGTTTYNTVQLSGLVITIANATAANPIISYTHNSPTSHSRSGVMRTTVTRGGVSKYVDWNYEFHWGILT